MMAMFFFSPFSHSPSCLCFQNQKINVNDFLDTLMSDPGPQCLMWLPILQRMAAVENGEGLNLDIYVSLSCFCLKFDITNYKLLYEILVTVTKSHERISIFVAL